MFDSLESWSRQMTRDTSERKSGRRLILSGVGLAGIGAAMALSGGLIEAAHADESGISYWLPGRFSSLAATPAAPGWSGAEVYYHTTAAASGAVAAAREIQIGRFPATANVNLNV